MLTRQAAWYPKPRPTFSDAIAAVRRDLWRCPDIWISIGDSDITKLPLTVFSDLAEALCYAP